MSRFNTQMMAACVAILVMTVSFAEVIRIPADHAIQPEAHAASTLA